MPKSRKTFALAGFAILLATAVLGAQTRAPAQNSRPCGAIDSVGFYSSNPFTAQRVSISVNSGSSEKVNTMEIDEILTRDNSGRVRIEKHMRLPGDEETVVLNTREGGTLTPTNRALKTSIMIVDCSRGKILNLQPGMQLAWYKEYPIGSPSKPGDRPYSSLFSTFLRGQRLPDLIVEDLGDKVIEGIVAHGVKITNLGTEKDGEWNGKPVNISETWRSDDLATTLLEVDTDFSGGHVRQIRLTGIKRVEPDPSLFEIPSGYKLNPTSAEMPFQGPH